VEAVIDTNVLVGDYLEDSKFHVPAKKTLDDLDRWLVPSVVLVEFVYTLRQLGVSDHLVGKKVSEILDDEKMNVVSIGASEVRDAIHIIDSEGASLGRFNDKLILSVAKRRGKRLATFDRGLRSQCRAAKVKPFA